MCKGKPSHRSEYEVLTYATQNTNRLKGDRLWHTCMSCMPYKGHMYNHECVYQDENMCIDIPMLTRKWVRKLLMQ